MRTIEILSELVRFNSVSDRSNLEILGWIQDYLDQHGIRYWTVFDAKQQKANLVASVGPDVAGGVVLSGHTDVVPVADQDWNTDPFRLHQQDGRLYGRGTCDMKGFVASCLAAVPQMKEAGMQRPIHLALSYDEEVGCLGAPDMIREMVKKLPPIDAVIVGEPTQMETVAQHKGSVGAIARFRGKSAHSSKPSLGVSAITYASRFMEGANAYADRLEAKRGQDFGLNPGYTTINMGTISGGTATNIVAEECRIDMSVRFMPDETAADHLNALQTLVAEQLHDMREKFDGSQAELVKTHEIPPLRPEEDGNAVRLCNALSGRNIAKSVSYGTEAGQFQEAGYSTAILGPGCIDQAHMPNEFIEVDQLRQQDEFLNRLIETMKT
ncbi:acetylornithine deacetylase [Primorskyibacter sp. 2E233]|uniref:acetylornithine deacetylase n=1 Tax=Primorskyibacter sp. 2E233 TaxID=3413431 RepID=UPI003BEFAA29